ncbi:hypothetical protein NDU88_003405 [Pleurodeles waltl]|uniref:Uncharacterized protein n=1 Tax=Pleurodeles waltl TaxID=8319 RepID=A0AAV7REU0_PLEWA|nr:hypothetical protein NDU88_003405 [Pleurodeles waltl]
MRVWKEIARTAGWKGRPDWALDHAVLGTGRGASTCRGCGLQPEAVGEEQRAICGVRGEVFAAFRFPPQLVSCLPLELEVPLMEVI